MAARLIFCCQCGNRVPARLTDGREIYPHRKDLADLPFWKCDTCQNFVGCHYKTADRTKPLGVIPTKELKRARSHIHRILDPVWRNKKMGRGEIYNRIAEHMGLEEYHTGELRSIDDAREVYRCVVEIRRQLGLSKSWGIRK